MQLEQDRLKADNQNLATAFREKARKHQQMQELYDRLKRKEMTAATQSAAFESVDDSLRNAPGRPVFGTRNQGLRDFHPFSVDHNGIEQVHTHQRSGSTHSQGSGGMMPPPPPRRSAFDANAFGIGTLPPGPP